MQMLMVDGTKGSMLFSPVMLVCIVCALYTNKNAARQLCLCDYCNMLRKSIHKMLACVFAYVLAIGVCPAGAAYGGSSTSGKATPARKAHACMP